MNYQDIAYAVDDRVAVITLNRPDRMNAFGKQLRNEFPDAVARADQDPEVRIIIVTGAGGRAFSTGYDQKESAKSEQEKSVEEWRKRMDSAYQFTRCVMDCSKPTIAVIDGYCLAGAMELAQMCDIRYCSDDARFGAIEARFSHGLATMIMPWIVGNHCRELIYTGDMFDAQEALRIGLISRIVEPADLLPEAERIAAAIAANSSVAVQMTKELATRAARPGDEEALRLYRAYFAILEATPEQPEAIRGFDRRERRAD